METFVQYRNCQDGDTVPKAPFQNAIFKHMCIEGNQGTQFTINGEDEKIKVIGITQKYEIDDCDISQVKIKATFNKDNKVTISGVLKEDSNE